MNILQSNGSEYIARFQLDVVNTPCLSQNTTVALRLAGTGHPGSKQILKVKGKQQITRLRSVDLSPSNPSILLHPMGCTADAETAKGL